jgi:hypothetical protein
MTSHVNGNYPQQMIHWMKVHACAMNFKSLNGGGETGLKFQVTGVQNT